MMNNQRRGYAANNSVNDALSTLDRELELLKQKRELLAAHSLPSSGRQYDRSQQHMQLDSDWNMGPNDYNNYDIEQMQSVFSPHQQYSFDNVSNVYQNGSSRGYRRFASTRPKKRQAAAPLERPPKRRFEGPKKFSPNNGKQSRKPQSNPKANAAPIKKEKIKNMSAESADDEILHEGVVPPKLLGRLELALGNILKEIRISFSKPPINILHITPDVIRKIKKEIRSRIHQMMYGKRVPSFVEMVDMYRALYPQSTDVEFKRFFRQERENSDNAGDKIVPVEKKPENGPLRSFKRYVADKLVEQLTYVFTKITDESAAEIDGDGSEKNSVEDAVVKNEDADVTTGEQKEEEKRTVEEVPTAVVDGIIPGPSADESVPTTYEFEEEFIKNTLLTLIPRMLPRYKTLLMKKIYEDAGFLAKMGTTNKTAKSIPNNKQKTKYIYIKVLGYPTLPNMKVVREFLGKFNPKSVKKHSAVHNLLFVSLTNQNDLNAVMAENGTKLENSTLTIKLTANTVHEPGESGDESLESTQVADNLLDSELDEKVTDLLKSVKSENESNETETTGDAEIKQEENTAEVVEDKEGATGFPVLPKTRASSRLAN